MDTHFHLLVIIAGRAEGTVGNAASERNLRRASSTSVTSVAATCSASATTRRSSPTISISRPRTTTYSTIPSGQGSSASTTTGRGRAMGGSSRGRTKSCAFRCRGVTFSSAHAASLDGWPRQQSITPVPSAATPPGAGSANAQAATPSAHSSRRHRLQPSPRPGLLRDSSTSTPRRRIASRPACPSSIVFSAVGSSRPASCSSAASPA